MDSKSQIVYNQRKEKHPSAIQIFNQVSVSRQSRMYHPSYPVVYNNQQVNNTVKSCIFTNSRYSNQICGDNVTLHVNEVCLALPPNVKWQELALERNADPYFPRRLLDYTRLLNRERKRTKHSRVRSTIEPMTPKKHEKFTSTSNKLITEFDNKDVKPSAQKCLIFDETMPHKKSEIQKKLTIVQDTGSSLPSREKKHSQEKSVTSKTIELMKTGLECSTRENVINDFDPNKIRELLKEPWSDSDSDVDCSYSQETLLNVAKNCEKNLTIEKLPAFLKKLTMRNIAEFKETWKTENTEWIANENTENTTKTPGETENNKNKNWKSKNANEITEANNTLKNVNKNENEDLPFDNYYDDRTIEEGIKNGTMFSEILRINTKNIKEAFISCSFDSRDVLINGVKDRNRALDGDEVVVELYSEEKWKLMTNDSVQRCGKVVSISKKNHPRTVVGHLKMVYGKSAGTIIWPRDNRLPRLRVKEKNCPKDFRVNHKRYNNTLFLAQITSWKSIKSAKGVILKMIGEDDTLEVESECILLENNLDIKYLDNTEEYLSKIPESIPEDVIAKREDIRSLCVFTIDPPTAKDLDDAISYRLLPNGNHEIGVHIADVTHYLELDSPLDEDARRKATSIYLTEVVYHMLPRKLSEICSLLPGSDKLAFSVFIEFDEDANILNSRFAKTILRSCVQLCYSHAQEIINKQNVDVNVELFPIIENGYTVQACIDIIWQLHLLSLKMRERRFANGALRIDQPKIMFQLNENKMPESYSLYTGKESNWLIEELMLMANILTANQIFKSFPNISLLRLHAAPKEESLTNVTNFLEKVGIFIDVSSAGNIFKSMMNYNRLDEYSDARMAVIMNFLIKPMTRAIYTCSAEKDENCRNFWHYALNVPFYTHFTSPIRRYADVVVHRLLGSSIGWTDLPDWNSEYIKKIATNCNAKKNAAKKASEMSSELFLRLYLDKHGPMKTRAVVADVKEKFFEVIDLSTRILCRIYVDKIKNAERTDYSTGNGIPSLSVTWKPDGSRTLVQVFRVIDVELSWKRNTDKYLSNNLNITLINIPHKE